MAGSRELLQRPETEGGPQVTGQQMRRGRLVLAAAEGLEPLYEEGGSSVGWVGQGGGLQDVARFSVY